MCSCRRLHGVKNCVIAGSWRAQEATGGWHATPVLLATGLQQPLTPCSGEPCASHVELEATPCITRVLATLEGSRLGPAERQGGREREL